MVFHKISGLAGKMVSFLILGWYYFLGVPKYPFFCGQNRSNKKIYLKMDYVLHYFDMNANDIYQSFETNFLYTLKSNNV